jgi:hypothetical protein
MPLGSSMRLGFGAFLMFFLIAGIAAMSGCADDQFVGPGKGNEPPQVWLSAAPPEGTVSNYTLHLFWGGWDPDGDIACYEYVITNNENDVFEPADTSGAGKWHRVNSNDSTFTFTADVLQDSSAIEPENLMPLEYRRSHTFFIRAVDDRGTASVRPAYRTFTSRTLSPIVDIIVPTTTGYNPATISPITTFKWTAKDFVATSSEIQDPDSVRWILVSATRFQKSWDLAIDYVRKNPHAPEWSPWRYYRAPADSGRSCTIGPIDFGPYVFGVQVKDEAGAVCPIFDEFRNIRRVSVSPRRTGPLLTVYNRYMGTMVTMSPSEDPRIIDLPANVPMSFRFTANASSYGGTVSGYRYGWDIQDLKDPTQWEVDYTPFVNFTNGVPTSNVPARTWQFDSHTLYVEVIDNSGYTSRIAVTVNIVPFTFRKSVLVIDDYDDVGSAGFAPSNGAAPNDEEHDAFWEEMLADVRDFDPVVDMVEVQTDLPIHLIADYRSIIWDAFCSYNLKPGISLLPEIIRFTSSDATLGGGAMGKVKPNILALYQAAGGHFLLCGEQPLTAVVNRDAFGDGVRTGCYPLIFRYELTGDQKSPYEESDPGVLGVGEESFGYDECCVNVLDLSSISNAKLTRKPPAQTCYVSTVRVHNQRTEGLRWTIPMDAGGFPTLELRLETAGPGKSYAPENRGLVNDIYNPPYFQSLCDHYAEILPQRPCIQYIYGHGCLNGSSAIYGAPVGFWTLTYADRVPSSGTGVAARSVVWGFEPVFFKPQQVKSAMDIILFDEWKLPRRP